MSILQGQRSPQAITGGRNAALEEREGVISTKSGRGPPKWAGTHREFPGCWQCLISWSLWGYQGVCSWVFFQLYMSDVSVLCDDTSHIKKGKDWTKKHTYCHHYRHCHHFSGSTVQGSVPSKKQEEGNAFPLSTMYHAGCVTICPQPSSPMFPKGMEL